MIEQLKNFQTFSFVLCVQIVKIPRIPTYESFRTIFKEKIKQVHEQMKLKQKIVFLILKRI